MIICKFCQQPSTLSPVRQLIVFNIDVYFCHNCNTEYVDYKTKITTSIYTSVNNKLYRWTINNNKHFIYSYAEFGVPGKSLNKGAKLISTFQSSVDNINPSNVQSKIENILSFI